MNKYPHHLLLICIYSSPSPYLNEIIIQESGILVRAWPCNVFL